MQTNFQRGDKKYYYSIHCDRQRALGNHPTSYSNFVNRLRKGMNLHDAIYTPRVERQVRDTNKTPIQDKIRRKQINKEENIQILDLDELTKLEMKELKTKGKNRYVFVKLKPTLRDRFLSLLKSSMKQCLRCGKDFPTKGPKKYCLQCSKIVNKEQQEVWRAKHKH